MSMPAHHAEQCETDLPRLHAIGNVLLPDGACRDMSVPPAKEGCEALQPRLQAV